MSYFKAKMHQIRFQHVNTIITSTLAFIDFHRIVWIRSFFRTS